MLNKTSAIRVAQKTLRKAIPYVGIGLHTGEKVSMVVRPAEADSGINFVRKDVPAGEGLIPAHWYNVVDTRMSTMIGNEYRHTINTVEHLMAALRGCGIDNAVIEIDEPEVPIMDGSSAPFVATIERVGTVSQAAARNAIWVQRPIEVHSGDKYAILMPSNTPRITAEIDFDNPAIGTQTYSVELVNEAFHRQVSRARTFGFRHQIEALRKRGLIRGGSLHNAILVDGDRIINKEGLRYRDEFVRHKILDCLGDLALAGVPILGHYYARKPGHELNNALMQRLFDQRGSWSYTTIDDFEKLTGARSEQPLPVESSPAWRISAARK
ncbi:MAG TPA: UDP-3-O-acyl-N-acetylglucosamine deacetylase [Gammaproteobacteria bacterium]|nr:UDP-3-O-acyl-N-acetylglucosamine deacetylase [Gammaproteobacteria bacterium]